MIWVADSGEVAKHVCPTAIIATMTLEKSFYFYRNLRLRTLPSHYNFKIGVYLWVLIAFEVCTSLHVFVPQLFLCVCVCVCVR